MLTWYCYPCGSCQFVYAMFFISTASKVNLFIFNWSAKLVDPSASSHAYNYDIIRQLNLLYESNQQRSEHWQYISFLAVTATSTFRCHASRRRRKTPQKRRFNSQSSDVTMSQLFHNIDLHIGAIYDYWVKRRIIYIHTFMGINNHPKRMFFIMCPTKKRNRKANERHH